MGSPRAGLRFYGPSAKTVRNHHVGTFLFTSEFSFASIEYSLRPLVTGIALTNAKTRAEGGVCHQS